MTLLIRASVTTQIDVNDCVLTFLVLSTSLASTACVVCIACVLGLGLSSAFLFVFLGSTRHGLLKSK